MGRLSLCDLRRVIFDPLAWSLSRNEIRELMRREELSQVINATKDYKGRGFYASIHAIQKSSEILALARLVQVSKPKVVVEIGTAKGGTLFIWARINPQLELAVSIDLPGGDFGGGYDDRRAKLYREFAYDRPEARMEFLRCDSHAASTLSQLEAILAARAIDFLYIDGDHAYDGVKKDFEMYAPLVRPGGLVAFHDIVTSGKGHDVSRFWNEVKQRFLHEEYIENPQGSMGIGVLHV